MFKRMGEIYFSKSYISPNIKRSPSKNYFYEKIENHIKYMSVQSLLYNKVSLNYFKQQLFFYKGLEMS